MDVYLNGVGHYIPGFIYSNDDLSRLMGVDIEKGRRYGALLGVESRSSCMDLTNGRKQAIACDEMAWCAAEAALADAGLSASDVDVVICCSSFFDFMSPSISSRLLKRLGLESAQTYDLMGGCAEFLHGLHLARLMIESGQASTILVTASEVITAWWAQVRHPLEFYIFGDAGGAFVLSGRPGLAKIRGSFVRTDAKVGGQPAELICVPILGGKAEAPLFYENYESSPLCDQLSDIPARYRIVHNGAQVGFAAPLAMAEAVKRSLGDADVAPTDVFVVPHQASRNVLSLLAKETKVPENQVGISLGWRGNMSTASIPVTMHDHRNAALASPNLVLTSVGVGMSYGAMLLEPTPVQAPSPGGRGEALFA